MTVAPVMIKTSMFGRRRRSDPQALRVKCHTPTAYTGVASASCTNGSWSRCQSTNMWSRSGNVKIAQKIRRPSSLNIHDSRRAERARVPLGSPARRDLGAEELYRVSVGYRCVSMVVVVAIGGEPNYAIREAYGGIRESRCTQVALDAKRAVGAMHPLDSDFNRPVHIFKNKLSKMCSRIRG